MLVITIGIVFMGLLSGVIVLLSNPNLRERQYYFILVLFIVGFSVTNFYTDHVAFSSEVRELALKWNFSLGPLSALFFYLFINEFTSSKVQGLVGRNIEKLLIISILFTAILSFVGDLLIRDVYILEGGAQVFITSAWDNLYVFVITIPVFWSLYILTVKYLQSEGFERLRLKPIVVGASIPAVLNVIILFLQRFLILRNFSGNSEVLAVEILPAISRSSFIVFFVFCSYAILRHQLFGIRVVLGKVFTWFGIATFFFGSFYVTLWFEQFIFSSPFEPVAIFLNIIIALSMAMIFSLYEKQLHHFVRTKFLFISYDIEDIKLELTELMDVNQSVSEKLVVFSGLIDDVFKIKKVGCVLYGVDFEEPVTSWVGFSPDEAVLLENEKLVNDLIENSPEGTVVPSKALGVGRDVMAVLGTMNTVGLGHYKIAGKEIVFILGGTVYSKVLSESDMLNIDSLVGVLLKHL